MKCSFEIAFARPDLYQRIIDFTYEHFFPREPLALANGSGKSRDPGHIQDILSRLSNGLSLIAIDKETRDLIGVAICNVVRRTDVVDVSAMSAGVRAIYQFLEHIEKGIDLFDRYQVDQGFELYFLGVHSDYGGRGIARALVQGSLELARERGFKFVRSNPTNPATMHLYDQAGFETLSEAKAYLFVKENGDPCFPDATKEDGARLCVKLF